MDNETIINTSTTKNSVAPLKLEPGDYRHHLDDFDLSEDQQNELLASLWSIILKKSVEHPPAKNFQHRIDSQLLI